MTTSDSSESLGAPPSAPATSSLGTARPPEVRKAVWLWIAAILLRVASLLAVYVTAASITARTPTARTTTGGLFAAPHIVFVIVTTAIGLAIVMIMRRGRNWARIVLTVVGVLNAVGLVGGLVFVVAVPVPQGLILTLGGPVGIAFDLAETVCIIVGIVLSYRPRANAYFAAARRRVDA